MKSKWIETTDRFVAFFDILGFKELVAKQSHETILEKLTTLKKVLPVFTRPEKEFPVPITNDQLKSVTFSDSIIVFSKENTYADIYMLFSCVLSLM